MKKLLSLVLTVFCLLVVFGCTKTEYSLKIEIIETVYEGESSNYTVTLLPDNKVIDDYEFKSENNDIFTAEKGKVIGVSEGSSTLTISCIDPGNKKEKITCSCAVKVEKKEVVKNYSLDVKYTSSINEKTTSELKVFEKETNTEIKDFEVFALNENIATYKDGLIYGLAQGEAEFKISCTFDGVKLNESIKITVLKVEEPLKYSLYFEYDKTINVGNTTYLKVFEKETNTEITVFNVESLNKEIATYENFLIYGLTPGVAEFKISCSFEGIVNLEATIQIEVKQTSPYTINIPRYVYENQVINVKVLKGGTEITDYEIIVDDEDYLFYDESSNTIEFYEECSTGLTLIVDGVSYKYTIDILKGFDLVIDFNNKMIAGQSEKITVYVNPGMIEITNYKLDFSNSEILSNKGNVITALKMGKSRLFVNTTYKECNLTAYVDVEVERKINYKLQSNLENYLFINEVKNLQVNLFPYNETLNDVVVTSSDENVIKVNGTELEALKLGEATITIKGTIRDTEYKQEIVVKVHNFTGIKLEIPEKLIVNEVASVKVIALPDNINITTKISSDSENLLCSSKNVYAKAKGEYVVTCIYLYNNERYSDTKNVLVEEVQRKVERLYVKGTNGLLEGTDMTLTTSTYPTNIDYKVKFISSDNNIITVNADGLVSAKGIGKAYITCILEGNETIKTIHNVYVLVSRETSIVEGTNGRGEYRARYYEEGVKNYYELMYGVKETTYYGYTSSITDMDVDGYGGLTSPSVKDQYYPQNVHLLEIPSTKNLQIVPWANLNGHIWTLTTVKGFIKTYEDLHPGKKVICAINGDFFDIKANGDLPYQTTGENVTNGEFYRTTNSHSAAGGTVGFTNNGTADSLIADGKAERTKNLILAIYDDNNNIVKELEIENINKEPGKNESSVYYGMYKDHVYMPLKVETDKTCFTVSKAELALPNNANDFYGLGTIDCEKVDELQVGSFTIVTDNEEVKSALSIGKKIRVQYEFTGKFKDVTGATGYNNLIYSDVNTIPDTYIGDRAPRTVIGKKADGTIVMMVVDGRQASDNMYGCDGTEVAAIMKAYGCVNAYNLDGGGSSTIVVRDETGLNVLNSPSDGRERTDGNCLLIVADDPNYVCEEVEVTDSKAVIKVSTDNSKLADKVPYLLIDGTYYEAINGLVTIENLVHNNTYNYKVYYKDGDNYVESLTVGSFKTKKSGFKFLGVTMTEDDDYFIFTSYCVDNDYSSNVLNMSVTLNDVSTYFKNGVAKLSKKIFGDYIDTIEFTYWHETLTNLETINVNEYFEL